MNLKRYFQAALAVAAVFWTVPIHGELVISEFMASNVRSLQDEDREYPDWIEISNTGAQEIDLDGYSLTDDVRSPRKWSFPQTNLQAGASIVVFASGKNRATPGKALHSSFSLSAAGEYLGLYAPDGLVLHDFNPQFPPQTGDVSFGLTGSTPRYFYPATPGQPNGAGFAAVAPAPAFSLVEGVYTNRQELVLSSTVPGAAIHYTVNGTEPTASSAAYSSPINIANSVVVRARVIAPAYAPGPSATRSYIMAGADAISASSNLPLIILTTFGRSPNESMRLAASMRVLDAGGDGRARLIQPEADFDGRATIRIRGSSSTQFPKKSYAVELIDERGDDQDASLLNMPADSDWILYAPYTDKTLIRDALAYDLSNRIGRYAPRTRFVEVYLDTTGTLSRSDYIGVYVLIEKIKRGKDRLDIEELLRTDLAEPAISGGYILKKDRLDPGDSGFTTTRQSLAYVDPKESEAPSAQRVWIRNWLNRFESTLYGSQYRNPITGYAAHIDTGSFIDHHLLVELAKNIDGFRLSTFMYKDRNAKLVMGPIWDYNLTFGNANYLDGWKTNGWYSSLVGDEDYPWYRRLFQDPEFKQAYADRWAELRRGPLSTEAILQRVDQMAAQLGEAQLRNYNKWRILGQYVWPNWYIGRTYEDEVKWMKQWITGRLAWMDSTFIAAPKLSRPAGQFFPGTELTLTGPGKVYYTTDGTDPRLFGGFLSQQAATYTEPLTLSTNLLLVSRSFSGSSWSAPVIAAYSPYSIPPSWRSDYFSARELRDPAISGDAADPDGDGSSNFQEYLAGTHPRDTLDALRLDAEPGAAPALAFTAAPYKRYCIESAPAPHGPWAELIRFEPQSTRGTLRYEPKPRNGAEYYRLQLVLE